MRHLLLTLLLASTPALALADTAKPTPAPTKPAPAKPAPKEADSFPLPKDATAPKDAHGGGGKIQMYEVPRGRDAVVTEMKDLLGKAGFTITKDDKSPSGRAIRLEVTKGDKLYKVSFTGDDTRTAIILTNP